MSAIRLVIRSNVKPGKVDQLKSAVTSLTELSRSHDGVQRYNFYLSADQSTFHGVEEYRDEGALGGHMAGLGDALGPLMETLDNTEIQLLGDISNEMRVAFADFGAQYASPIGGFSR